MPKLRQIRRPQSGTLSAVNPLSFPAEGLLRPTHTMARLMLATPEVLELKAEAEGPEVEGHKLNARGIESVKERPRNAAWGDRPEQVLEFGPQASLVVDAGPLSERMNVFAVEVLVKPADQRSKNQRLVEAQSTPFALALVRDGAGFRVRASAYVKHRPRAKDKTQWIAAESSKVIRPNRWTSVGMAWTGDDLLVFVNGQVVGRRVCRNADLATLDKPKKKFWIGSWVDRRRNRYRGRMAGVRVWNTLPDKLVEAISKAEDAGLGAIDSRHQDFGGDRGTLGEPKSKERAFQGGRLREYAKGGILWHADHGAHPLTGKLWIQYKGKRPRAGLGFPITDPIKRGRATAVHCERGAVYTSKQTTGCVWGPLYSRYLTLTKVLGLPVNMPFGSLAEPERRCNFERGMMYYSKSTGAFEVHGSILAHYKHLGGDSGFLGLPLSDELVVYDGRRRDIGRVSRFEHGAIYWSPSTGAHEVHGMILKKYEEIGGPASELGFPVTDESSSPEAGARYSMFERGMIVWHNGQAFVVTELELFVDHIKQHGAIDDGAGDSGGEFYTKLTITCNGESKLHRKRFPRKGHKNASVNIKHRFRFPVRPDTKVYFKVDIWDHDDLSGDDYHGRIEKTLTAADLWAAGSGVGGKHLDNLTTIVRANTPKFDRIRCSYTVASPDVRVTKSNFREVGWWNFPNRGTAKLSKAQYVECFRDVDYWDGTFEAVLNAFDALYYDLAFKEAASGGNCYGFCTEGLHSLQGHSQFNRPLSKWNWNQSRPTINVKQAYQYGAETINWAIKNLLNLNMIEPCRVYDAAKREIDRCGACIISMMSLTSGTGHAVLAYAYQDGGPNGRRGCLFVADPNTPWSQAEGHPSYIEVYNNNRFKAETISTRSNPNGFSSNPINFAGLVELPTTLMFHVPYRVISSQPRTPFWEILGALFILLGFLLVLAGDAEVEQFSVNGKNLFKQKGGKRRVTHGQLPGVAMIPVLDTNKPQLMFASAERLAGQMRMDVTGKRRGRYRASSGLGMSALTVDSPIAARARDSLIVDAVGSPFPIANFETSQRSKTARVDLGITMDPTGRPGRRYSTQLQQAKGDTARIAIEARGGGLILSPGGSAKPVDVEIEVMDGGQARRAILRGLEATSGTEALRVRAQDLANPLGNYAVERLSSVGGGVLETKTIKGKSR